MRLMFRNRYKEIYELYPKNLKGRAKAEETLAFIWSIGILKRDNRGRGRTPNMESNIGKVLPGVAGMLMKSKVGLDYSWFHNA